MDLPHVGADGRGQINILAADNLMGAPRLYATFLLWLLSELFETLPEVGDPDKPKLVFFFDEAHLLFDEAPVAQHIWESSRVFVSDAVPAKLRLRVQCALIDEMVRSSRAFGATSLIGIVPEHSPRLARRTGIDCVPAGPVIETDDGDRSVCINIALASKLH